MMALRTLLSRLRDLRHKDALDQSLDDEVRFHLEMQTAENIRRGMAPEEARYAALRQFGGVEQRKEEWRELRFLPRLESLWQDVRHAARSVIHARGLAVFAILSLALGIGANTAVFLMVRTLVLRPLPYPEPQELVQVFESLVWMGSQSWGTVSVPNLKDWRQQETSFDGLAAYAVGGVNFTHGDDTLRLPACHVEAGVFSVMGIRPFLGRAILPEENAPGRNRVAVLSYGLWQRRFGADPAVIGTKVGIDGAESVIVGVMPDGFQFPPRSRMDLWTPLVFPDWALAERGDHWLNVVGRLKPTVSVTAANLEMNGIARRLSQLYPEDATRGVRLESLHVQTVKSTASILVVLSFAVAVVLLLACANVAHLILARTAGRRREFALRAALGASPWRVARLAFIEGVLLAAAGGVAGLLAARWSLDGLLRMPEAQLPAGFKVDWDWTVVAFCVGAAAVAAILSGLIPSLGAARIDLQSALKEAGSASGYSLRRNRSLLMIWEIALALILVAGALSLFRSLQVFNRFDLGFDHERVLSMKVTVPENRYRSPRQVTDFYHHALDSLLPLPGISEAALINLLPVSEPHASSNFSIRGRTPPAPGHEPGAEHRLITPGYFRAMGIPLVAGRYFTDADMQGPTRTAIINRRTAELYWPGQNPVGSWVAIGTAPKPDSWMRVVGVVDNIRHAGPYRPVRTALYLPLSRSGTEYAWPTMNVVVRSDRDPEMLGEVLRRRIRELDPDVAVYQVRTMAAIVSDSISGTRLLARLLTIFSALAVVLALAGVYGVMACLVTERTHEIGVRMSLGATRRQVLGSVLARGLRTGLTGVMLGILGTGPLIMLARHYLLGVGLSYVWTFAVAGLGLLAVTLLASLPPAWRASTVDPLVALRDE